MVSSTVSYRALLIEYVKLGQLMLVFVEQGRINE